MPGATEGEILATSGAGEPETLNANAAAGATEPPITCARHDPGALSTTLAVSDVDATPDNDVPESLTSTPLGDDNTSVGDAGKLTPVTINV
jgi:hypothetical protein